MDENLFRIQCPNVSSLIPMYSSITVTYCFANDSACDTRVYEYLLPSYALLPPRPGTHLHKRMVENAQAEGQSYEEHDFWKGYDHEAGFQDTVKLEPVEGSSATEGTLAAASEADMTPAKRRTQAELAKKRNFRISEAEVERFRELMKAYLGSQSVSSLLFQRRNAKLSRFGRCSNFHNYTLNKSFNDPSCKRYMIDIDVAPPVENNGMEWLSVKIHGQSFMLHQIVSSPIRVQSVPSYFNDYLYPYRER